MVPRRLEWARPRLAACSPTALPPGWLRRAYGGGAGGSVAPSEKGVGGIAVALPPEARAVQVQSPRVAPDLGGCASGRSSGGAAAPGGHGLPRWSCPVPILGGEPGPGVLARAAAPA